MKFDELLKKLKNPKRRPLDRGNSAAEDVELEDAIAFSPQSIKLQLIENSPADFEEGEFSVPNNNFDRRIYNSPTQDIPHSSTQPRINGHTVNIQDEEHHAPETQLLGPRQMSLEEEAEEQRGTGSNVLLFGIGGIRLCLILAMIIFVITIVLAVTGVFIMDSNSIGEERSNKTSRRMDNTDNATNDEVHTSYHDNWTLQDVRELGSPENHTDDSAIIKMLHENENATTEAPYLQISVQQKKMNISQNLIRESYINALNSFAITDNENKTSNESLLERHGLLMELAYHEIVKKLNLSIEQAEMGDILLQNATLPADLCPGLISSRPQCDKTTTKYRSLDGTCNHLNEDGLKWGSINEPYRRLVFPHYEDGISSPRSQSALGNKQPLPSARPISRSVHSIVDTVRREDSGASLMLPLWAHFISHDIMYTAKFTSTGPESDCCKVQSQGKGQEGPLNNSEKCFPILVRKDKSTSCLNFQRAAPHASCNFGPREQRNKATSFIDGSHIYGVTPEIVQSLRVKNPSSLKKGQMELDDLNGVNLLPLINKTLAHCTTGRWKEDIPVSITAPCFMGGDDRVNELDTLIALQTIWVRHHNQLAEKLSELNQHWGDEQVFQETRKTVVAQIQHITYNEFLPVILGQSIMSEEEDLTLKSNYYSNDSHTHYNGFNIKVNPGISNEFSIAFQFYISMMQRMGPRMSSSTLLRNDGELDSLLMVASIHRASMMDSLISTFGTDLAAEIILEGRDQGIPSYLEVAKKCGLELKGNASEDFSILNGTWDSDALKRVKSVYESVKDVDLFTGLLSELPARGSRLGPTLACIIKDQFSRLRRGDFFWYEGDIYLDHFSKEQLEEIRKTSLAKIICTNSKKTPTFQAKIMLLPSNDFNPIFPCEQLLNTTLDAWKEPQRHFHGHHGHENHTSGNKTGGHDHNTHAEETENDDDDWEESGSKSNEVSEIHSHHQH